MGLLNGYAICIHYWEMPLSELWLGLVIFLKVCRVDLECQFLYVIKYNDQDN